MKFAPEVAMFCFPHGVRLVTPDEAAVHAIPVVTSFVLTAADKSRMYGACIVWYEQLPSEVVFAFLEAAEALPPDGAPQPVVHAPEAVCLLSRVPIFEALMECCRQLFRMRISSNGALSAEALEDSSVESLLSVDDDDDDDEHTSRDPPSEKRRRGRAPPRLTTT